MDGFARRKEQSKDDIRRAAWELFSQFGVDKVSIADIARKAGVSQATIYNNFGSKEVLAREFVTYMVDQLLARTQTIWTPEMRYSEKIAAYIQFITDMLVNERPTRPEAGVFPVSVDLLNDPEIRRIREIAQEKMTRILLGVVQEGRDQGLVNPDLSDEAIAIYFKVFMDVFTDPKLQHSFAQHPKIVKDLSRLMLSGLHRA